MTSRSYSATQCHTMCIINTTHYEITLHPQWSRTVLPPFPVIVRSEISPPLGWDCWRGIAYSPPLSSLLEGEWGGGAMVPLAGSYGRFGQVETLT